jgi:hypothetical protein
VKIRGLSNVKSYGLRPKAKAECMKAPYSANPTKVAEPIAKPFPIAAVVFPAESRTSVLYRTIDGSSAI